MLQIKKLDIYILKACYKNFLATLIVIISFIGLITLSEQLSRITPFYNFFSALKFSIITAISETHNYIPMSLAIGSLITLGKLSNQSELVVMQTTGYSKLRICLALLGLSIPISLIDIGMNQYVNPQLKEQANAIKYQGDNNNLLINAGEPNVWFRINNQFIYAEFMESDKIHNLTIYKELANHDLEISMVKLATWNKATRNWTLHNIYKYQIPSSNLTGEKDDQYKNITSHNISNSTIAEQLWDLDLDPTSVNLSSTNLNDLSIIKLLRMINHMNNLALPSNQAKLIFYGKLMSPIIFSVMVLISLSLIFTNLRATSIIKRVFIGIFISIVFYISNQIFGQMTIIYEIPAIIGSLLPSALLLIVAIYFLIRPQ